MIDHIISQSCYKAVTRSLGFRMALYIFKQLYNQKSFPPCADTTPVYKKDACLTKKSDNTFFFFLRAKLTFLHELMMNPATRNNPWHSRSESRKPMEQLRNTRRDPRRP